VHAVVADLCTPGLHVRATEPEERGRTVSSFAASTGVVAAINGDFFGRAFAPSGLAVGNGVHWPGTRHAGVWSAFVFGERRAEVPVDPADPRPAWVHEAVGGLPQVVMDGVPIVTYFSRFCDVRHPRSALGLSEDARTLYMIAIEGRSPRSVGATCGELAEIAAELGAWQAINLDGGGSTALFIEGRGVVTSPSEGAERPVANHVGLTFGTDGAYACPSALDEPNAEDAPAPASTPAPQRPAPVSSLGAPRSAPRTERARETRSVAVASLGAAGVALIGLAFALRAGPRPPS
jgi:hypothetical protein